MCASTVLGAASVAGSFLGATALRGSVDVLSVLALASFGVCFGSAVWVLRPYHLAFALREGPSSPAAKRLQRTSETRIAVQAPGARRQSMTTLARSPISQLV